MGGESLPRNQRDEAVNALIQYGYARTGAEAMWIIRDWRREHGTGNPRVDYLAFLEWLMKQPPGGYRRRVAKQSR